MVRYFSKELGGPFPNMKDWQGIQSLPEGALLKPDARRGYVIDNFILDAAKSIGMTKRKKVLSLWHDYNVMQGGIQSSLLNGLTEGEPDAFKIADAMTAIQPNLSWLRGGELVVKNEVAILDNPNAGGLLGIYPESFVKEGYDGVPRNNPAVFSVQWKDIVEMVRLSAMRVYSKHFRDMSLMAAFDTDEMVDWQRQHVTVFRVGNKST